MLTYKIKRLGCPVFSYADNSNNDTDLPYLTTISGYPLSLAPNAYIISVGRHHPQKDHSLLIRSYALMRNSGFELPLIIFGSSSDPLTSHLIALTRQLSVASSVYFVDPVDQLSPFLQNASFMMHTAAWEGLGNSLIECLSVGTPVVAVSCPGGIQDYLSSGSNGLIIDSRDPRTIARETMLSLGFLNNLDPLLVSRSVSSYSIDTICSQISDLLITDN